MYSAPLQTNNEQWWTLKLNEFDFNSNSMMASGMNYGIVDSGTSLLYLTTTDYSNF